MRYKIHPDNPEGRKIKAVVETLENGGVIIYPTDSVYAIGCDIEQVKAIDELCSIKGVDPVKANLTVLCEDISQASEYTMPLPNSIFKMIKRNTPGPFTFILNANHRVPKRFKNKKRTIGVRIPDNAIAQALLKELGRPIITTSLRAHQNEVLEYYIEMEAIESEFGKRVDAIIDGGAVPNEPSTIVDCTLEEPVILREGVQVLR